MGKRLAAFQKTCLQFIVFLVKLQKYAFLRKKDFE